MRDLFQQDDGGWLENVGLLDGLVAEKLKAEAEKIAAEGWKWIEVNVDLPFGHTHRLRELEAQPTRQGIQDDPPRRDNPRLEKGQDSVCDDVAARCFHWLACGQALTRPSPASVGAGPTLRELASSGRDLGTYPWGRDFA
jgi:hypothetical protein